MGFENRIFIIAEQFAMSGSNSSRGGGFASEASEAKSNVDLSRSVSPRPRDAGRDATVESGEGFKHISLRGLPDPLKTLIVKYNQFGFTYDMIMKLVVNGSITYAQASTAGRSQIGMVLEIGDRGKRFLKNANFSFIIRKLFQQLATLGKTHSFMLSDLIFLVCQSTPSAECIDRFVAFAQILSGLEVDLRTFWLMTWLCVMTMTNVPYNPELYKQFLDWYEAVIQGHESLNVDENLATILEDLQTRVRTATNALPPNKGNREQIERACQQLCIELPPLDEDGEEEPDDASVGGQSAASSVASLRGTPKNLMHRFEEGFAAIEAMMALFCENSSLTSAMKPDQFEKLIRALIRGMTHRSKGKRSRRSFNKRLSDWILFNCNSHSDGYQLNPANIAAQIIKATCCHEFGLLWFNQFSPEVNNVDALRPALTSALILITLGNHTHIKSDGVFDAIMDECCSLSSKQSKFSRQFETIFRSAKTSCEEAVDQALQGSWEVPEHITQQLAARAARHRPQPRQARVIGGGSAISHQPKARASGGGGGSAAVVAEEDPEIQELLRQQRELAAKIAAAKSAKKK
jgi:hypothetical protein